MNTTSMEFVIAQGKTKQSPLVLSEFMGISFNMAEAQSPLVLSEFMDISFNIAEALQINPWNLGVCIILTVSIHPLY